MKYFLFSDTHGIDPSIVTNKLKDKGFNSSRDDHCIVIAGDIVDGYGHDNELLELIRSFKNKIVIKGNHALGDSKTYWWHNTTYEDYLSPENREYIESLDYQTETPNFYLAHGLYINIESVNTEQASVWASPVLFGKHILDKNWFYIDPIEVRNIRKAYKDSIGVYAESFDKLLFLGHFSESALMKYTKEANYKLEKNKQGFYQYKNIIWLDKRVGDDVNNFDIYVMEVE